MGLFLAVLIVLLAWPRLTGSVVDDISVAVCSCERVKAIRYSGSRYPLSSMPSRRRYGPMREGVGSRLQYSIIIVLYFPSYVASIVAYLVVR